MNVKVFKSLRSKRQRPEIVFPLIDNNNYGIFHTPIWDAIAAQADARTRKSLKRVSKLMYMITKPYRDEANRRAQEIAINIERQAPRIITSQHMRYQYKFVEFLPAFVLFMAIHMTAVFGTKHIGAANNLGGYVSIAVLVPILTAVIVPSLIWFITNCVSKMYKNDQHRFNPWLLLIAIAYVVFGSWPLGLLGQESSVYAFFKSHPPLEVSTYDLLQLKQNRTIHYQQMVQLPTNVYLMENCTAVEEWEYHYLYWAPLLDCPSSDVACNNGTVYAFALISSRHAPPTFNLDLRQGKIINPSDYDTEGVTNARAICPHLQYSPNYVILKWKSTEKILSTAKWNMQAWFWSSLFVFTGLALVILLSAFLCTLRRD